MVILNRYGDRLTNVKNTIEQKQMLHKRSFQDVGMAMLNSMGGASGVIFSAIFLGDKRFR